jgi:hypothetical protein
MNKVVRLDGHVGGSRSDRTGLIVVAAAIWAEPPTSTMPISRHRSAAAGSAV